MQLDGRTKKQKWKQTSKFDFLPENRRSLALLGFAAEKHLAIFSCTTRRQTSWKKQKKSNFIDDYVCQLCVREIVLSIYFLLCLTENFGFAPSRAERGSVMSFLR